MVSAQDERLQDLEPTFGYCVWPRGSSWRRDSRCGSAAFRRTFPTERDAAVRVAASRRGVVVAGRRARWDANEAKTDPGQDEIAGVIDDQGQVAVAEILAALPDESDFARQVVVYLVSVWNVRRSTLSAVAEAAKPGRGEAMVGQVVQELLDEGKTEGRTEGRAEGRADSLTELLEHRFGQLPEAVLSLIASASQAELVTWFKAALDATSLVAVFEGHALD